MQALIDDYARLGMGDDEETKDQPVQQTKPKGFPMPLGKAQPKPAARPTPGRGKSQNPTPNRAQVKPTAANPKANPKQQLNVPATKPKRAASKGSDVNYAERRKQVKVGDIFSMKEDRLVAVGGQDDFPRDKLLNFLTANAETLCEPKKILDGSDWLLS